MTGMTTDILLILVSYLVGAIPNGLLVARARGVDIRKVGSGNIGATNVFRSVGKCWGILTFVGDALKGYIPSFFFPLLACSPPPWLGLACGCAAIAGHNWPVYLRFKGGKGIATSAGVLLGVAPAAVGIGLGGWILLFVTTRYVSVASIGAAILVPASAWLLYSADDLVLPIVLSLLGVLAVWRHRTNIKRLLGGEENRFDFRKKKAE